MATSGHVLVKSCSMCMEDAWLLSLFCDCHPSMLCGWCAKKPNKCMLCTYPERVKHSISVPTWVWVNDSENVCCFICGAATWLLSLSCDQHPVPLCADCAEFSTRWCVFCKSSSNLVLTTQGPCAEGQSSKGITAHESSAESSFGTSGIIGGRMGCSETAKCSLPGAHFLDIDGSTREHYVRGPHGVTEVNWHIPCYHAGRSVMTLTFDHEVPCQLNVTAGHRMVLHIGVTKYGRSLNEKDLSQRYGHSESYLESTS